MDIARTQNYLIIFVLLARKHGIISNTKPVIQGCIFNGIHSDWIGELQKDDFEKLKYLTYQLIQQEGSEEKALASFDARLENGYRSELKAIEIRFHELLKEQIGNLLDGSSFWEGGIAPQIGINLTSLALIDVNSGWSALPFTSLSWTITDKNGIVTLKYSYSCRMGDTGYDFDITSDNTKLTYDYFEEWHLQIWQSALDDSNPISAEKESQIATTTKYDESVELQPFYDSNPISAESESQIANTTTKSDNRWIGLGLPLYIFIAVIAFVYKQGVFESKGFFLGNRNENQPKAEMARFQAEAKAKNDKIPLTGQQKADLERALTLDKQVNNLYSQGKYAEATPLALEALKIRREALGDKYLDAAASIHNLAILRITSPSTLSTYLDTAASINMLAALYFAQTQYAKAEPLFVEALKIRRETLGNKHPSTAGSINNLALLYSDQAQYAKAEPLYLEALKIRREVLGNKHPNTAMSINNLAKLYNNLAQYAKAEPLYLEALKIRTDHLQATSIIQSENAQILMANNSKYFLNSFLTNALANHTPGGGYDHVLSWKGMIYRRQNLLRALQGNDPLKKELSDTIRQLATLLNSTPKPGEEQAFQDKVKALSEKKEDLEKELAKLIPSLNLAKVTPPDLQNIIALDAALIDMFQYRHSSPPKEGQGKLVFEYRYAAWIIRKDKPIVRLELGSAEDLNNLVFQWRTSLSTRKSPSEGPQDPALALREKVWLPIAKHLEGAKTVIISPDGMLGTLPFTALPGEDIKKYLIEERNIAVVPFLQTLPDLLAKKESTGKNLLAVGDVAYDAEPGSGSLLAKTALRNKNTLKWAPLEGTRAEMVAIRDSFEQKFPDAKSMQLRKAQATEEAFRQQAPKANFLHIATHGFFVEAAPLTTGSKNSAKIDNPGLQSGLVLAGANQPLQAGLDDGILTASEVAELDLTGVEQAVLSACETGLGKSLAGEGLLGLQRAFQLAGARTVVASMWKVPDLATKELMTRYYENIWEKKMGKLEALREAQLWMLKEGKKRGIDAETVDTKDGPKPAVVETGNRMPPLYWGAWVLSGAWN